MGLATARRTFLRARTDRPLGYETREDMAERVSRGNTSLHASGEADYQLMYDGIRTGLVLLAGRHLQQGDASQPSRNQDLYTNCSSAPLTFALFNLLLNGSGVGRSYDDVFMTTDWRLMPRVYNVLSESHADYGKEILGREWLGERYSTTVGGAIEKAKGEGFGDSTISISVKDTREGWAEAVELIENLAYLNTLAGARRVSAVVLDYSGVRCYGSPIKGMQNRPASGPNPLMWALETINVFTGGGELDGLAIDAIAPWRQAMVIDHTLASVVAVGGARRAARIACKNWRDSSVFEFIEFKRIRDESGSVKYATSNNSVMVDEEFWAGARAVFAAIPIESRVRLVETAYGPWAEGYDLIDAETSLLDGSRATERFSASEIHAANVFLAATYCSYYDGTGEPGLINADRLTRNDEGLDQLIEKCEAGRFDEVAGVTGLPFTRTSRSMYLQVLKTARSYHSPVIVNPCAEIALYVHGGVCVIGDVSLGGFVKSRELKDRSMVEMQEDFVVFCEATARFLIRVNLMRSTWNGEIQRTNRIGVGLTGIADFALGAYAMSLRDVASEGYFEAVMKQPQSGHDVRTGLMQDAFWNFLARGSRAVHAESARYSAELGLPAPHTCTTLKPAGSNSAIDNLCNGAHGPANTRFLRNTQFASNDPLVGFYRENGYPVHELTSEAYRGMTIVGFPTRLYIDELAERLGLLDKVVTAAELTPEEQFRYLVLLERFWLRGNLPDSEARPNSISYTLKYNAKKTSHGTFAATLLEWMPRVACCSVMPEFPAEMMPNPHSSVQTFIDVFDGYSEAKDCPYEYVPEQILSLPVYKAVEKMVYESMDTVSIIEDIGMEHLDCGTGGCPIVYVDNVNSPTV